MHMDDNVSVWDANNDELRLLFLCHDVIFVSDWNQVYEFIIIYYRWFLNLTYFWKANERHRRPLKC